MRSLGLAGLVLGAVLVGAIVLANGGDPVILLAMGPRAWGYDYAVDLVGRDVATWSGWGHDGQFFFVQATNPLWVGDTDAARLLNLELYRSQRMLFPLVVGLGGLTPGPALPWMFGLVHVVAFGIGTAAVGSLAEQRGASRWWGLLFATNPAMAMSVQIGGAGVLALALALAATAAVGRERNAAAAVLFALAALSREVMLFYCAGVVLYEWWRTRRVPVVLGAVPIGAFAAWYGYLLLRLEYESPVQSNNSLDLPFRGLLTAAEVWNGDAAKTAAAALVCVMAILVIRLLVRQPSAFLAGAAAFSLLTPFLGAPVWLNAFDVIRATSPLFIAFALGTFTEAQISTDDGPAVATLRRVGSP